MNTTRTSAVLPLSRSILAAAIGWFGCVAVASLHAEVLIEERFDYEPGRLVDVSSGLWKVHFDSAPLLLNDSGAAILNQPDAVRGREDVHRLLPMEINPLADNVTKLYAGFTVKFAALPTGEGGRSTLGSFFAHFRSGYTEEAVARVGANVQGAAPGKYRMAACNAGWNLEDVVQYPVDLSLGTSYRVVVGFDFAGDQMTLWVDPADESSASVTATDVVSYSGAPIDSFALRQGYVGNSLNYGAYGMLSFDDLVIGNRFSEVLVIPEPSSGALLCLGLVVLGCFRRPSLTGLRKVHYMRGRVVSFLNKSVEFRLSKVTLPCSCGPVPP